VKGRCEGGSPGADESVGLCSICRFAAVQRSARLSVFWRCRRADTDPGFRRYPPLPVKECPGFERAPGGQEA
jgi:hypothetical protein